MNGQQPTVYKREYCGQAIVFDPESFLFRVAGPLIDDIDLCIQYESAVEAQEAIDKAVKNAAFSKRVKLNVLLLNEDGHDVVLTGFHSSNFRMLGVGSARIVYPNEPKIRDALHLLCDMRRRSATLGIRLNGLAIGTSAPWGTKSVEQRSEACLAEITAKTAAARKLFVDTVKETS